LRADLITTEFCLGFKGHTRPTLNRALVSLLILAGLTSACESFRFRRFVKRRNGELQQRPARVRCVLSVEPTERPIAFRFSYCARLALGSDLQIISLIT